MTSLLHAPIAVHSNYEGPALLECPADIAPFEPTLGDYLYELGREVGLEGKSPSDVRLPDDELLTRPERLRFARGVHAGRRERAISDARELGYALGSDGQGLSEPPAGLDADERAAYREGYAAGLDEHDCFEDLARREAWDDFLDWVYDGHDFCQAQGGDNLPSGMTD